MTARRVATVLSIAWVLSWAPGCQSTNTLAPPWDAANPVRPIPPAPLGLESYLGPALVQLQPERVRLGRWLFYDTRLSADGTVSCATCHRPEHAFSEPTAVSSGVGNQRGRRKAPSFLNQAATLYPHFFWDGRAKSLEEQALGPIENPIEMGNTHDAMLAALSKIRGYQRYFNDAFGTTVITKELVASAIADYERTRMSGNAPYDRWRITHDDTAVSADAKRGRDLFFGKAGCVQCHVGSNFTDSRFHNIGIGWDPEMGRFLDEGRFTVTHDPADRGAFKTPSLREVTRRAPYMHDGSVATLREVVKIYSRGGLVNPTLDPRVEPLALTDTEVDDLLAFLTSLEGEGYHDTPPTAFPQ